MDQSLRHYAVHQAAIEKAKQTLQDRLADAGDTARPALIKRLKSMQKLKNNFAQPLPLMSAIVVKDLMAMPNGFLSTATALQDTLCPFFPLQLQVGILWCTLVRASGDCHQATRHGSAQAPLQGLRRKTRSVFKCAFCGLITETSPAMLGHFRQCHNPDTFRHEVPDTMWVPIKVSRQVSTALPR